MDGGRKEDGAAVFTLNEILWFHFGADIEERIAKNNELYSREGKK